MLYASYSTLRRVLSATAVHVVCEYRSLHLVQQVCCTCVLPSTGHSPFWGWGTGTAHTWAAAHCFTSISSHLLLLLASRWFISVRRADCWSGSSPYIFWQHSTITTPSHSPSSASCFPLPVFLSVVAILSRPGLPHTRTSTVVSPAQWYQLCEEGKLVKTNTPTYQRLSQPGVLH